MNKLHRLLVRAVPIIVVAASTSPGLEPGNALERAGFPRAWELSRGEGVTVGVVGSLAPALGRIVREAAPASHVLSDSDDDPGDDPDEAAATAVTRLVSEGARVILLPLDEHACGDALEAAIGRAHARGVLVVAGSGDEGLSHESEPARRNEVIAVAALDPEGDLAPGSNAGRRTIVAAPGTGSQAAAALVAGAAALAISYDPSITPGEIRAALEAGAPVSSVVTSAASLDARAFLERLRPRSRGVTLRRVEVTPAFPTCGRCAHVRIEVMAHGRRPCLATVVMGLVGSLDRVALPLPALEPGASLAVEGDILVPALGALPIEPVLTRTNDRGIVPAYRETLEVDAGSASTRVPLLVVASFDASPGVALREVDASRGLVVVATIADVSGPSNPQGPSPNGGADDGEESELRLVAASGEVLARVSVGLAKGERRSVRLEGRLDPGESTRPVPAWLEVARTPRGFHETLEARVPLVLDPAGAHARSRHTGRQR